MAKLTRVFQKIFGSTASAGRIGVFGSLNAGSASTTTNPETMQSLGNWLQGWDGSILANNSPPLEDMNAAFYVAYYQLAYLMQQGIAEWNSETTYFIGSVVNDSGKIYISKTDNNINNATTNIAHWIGQSQTPIEFAVTGILNDPMSVTEAMIYKIFDTTTITSCSLLVGTAGTSGTISVDIQYKRGAGAWTSILSAPITALYSTGNYYSANGTLAVQNLLAGDLLRLNINSVQSGMKNFSVFLERSG